MFLMGSYVNKTLPPSVKRQTTTDNLLLKDRKENKKMETANAQNSTFANRTSRHTTKICKRAVFLPTHPHDTDTIDVSCKQFDFLIR